MSRNFTKTRRNPVSAKPIMHAFPKKNPHPGLVQSTDVHDSYRELMKSYHVLAEKYADLHKAVARHMHSNGTTQDDIELYREAGIANIIPFLSNPRFLHAEIERKAYELWEHSGKPEGRADEFWYKAENIICHNHKHSCECRTCQ